MIRSAMLTGFAYGLLAFAAGFVLDSILVLVLAPLIGDPAAVLIELPGILTLSWILCAWLIRVNRVSASISVRTGMGLSALTLLLAAELPVSVYLLDRTLAEHFAIYQTTQGM